VLISSHVLAEVAQTVEDVLIIARGRLAAAVELDDLPDRARSLEERYLELTARDPA
jgi:ABC-2 type transport system ATP-binding protein